MADFILTGASGFLGRQIQDVLSDHSIITVSRTDKSVKCDLSVQVPELTYADTVIHAAGKAHVVPKTERERQEFFDINITGTKNLLLGLEKSALPRSFVFISTVAVYGKDEGNMIGEEEPLNAKDPYGYSKIQAENIVQEWCSKNNVTCSILRLPLLAGPNPPGNLAAMINGIRSGYYFNIAGGKARKSIVLAEDIARIIPQVSQRGGTYNLSDGYHPSFRELSEKIAAQLGKGKPFNIPGWMAMLMAKTGDVLGSRAPINSSKLLKMTSDLTFSDAKARRMLGWNPAAVLQGFRIR